MKRLCSERRPTGLICLIAGMLVLLWMVALRGGAGAQGPEPARRPSVVAAVDMSRLLARSDEWRDAMAHRQSLLAAKRRVVSPLLQDAKLLEVEYRNQPPGTPERKKAQEDYLKALQQLKQVRREKDTQIAMHLQACWQRLLDRVRDVAAAHAREHGIDLVLNLKSPGITGASGQPTGVETGQIVYAAPQLDISEALIGRLNEQYAAPVEAE